MKAILCTIMIVAMIVILTSMFYQLVYGESKTTNNIITICVVAHFSALWLFYLLVY